ncbi:endo-1,4-beta-xylanase [Segatella copri]|uniref:Beta-xylanase n=1 Tax=Segatella copri TaxID=165179 RepID=A0AA90VLN1_9BACT|nr:endo-1,4-beta-xylanase [Segatella copri]MCW4126318.1 endo-1,4-beta-xylanase [Segatella copri]MCW4134377.1 endo-1,4-beta-xylanase [Segatella copri]MQO92361.1 endo-1,4-beta-xylanase [Segatella copri]
MKLKNINFGLGLVALLALSSCADDKFSEYRTDMTKNLKEYQYLNNYEPLKKYVEDMKASGKCNPDFKLGIALAAPDFNKQELVYCLAGSNFEEMTAGNAMKYASCVKDDGTFDFNTVKDFVTNAQDAGLTIYGHTLAWHSQQNKKYLSKLIADKEIQVDPSQKVDKVDAYTDFSKMNSFPFYVMDYTPEIKDGILISKYPGKWYQYFVVDNYPVDVDAKREYKVTAMIKASEDGQIDVQTGNWGATTSQKMSVSTQWKEQSVTFSGLTTEKAFVVFQPGDFAGDISCKWVKVTHSEAPVMEIETEVHKETYTDGDFPFYAMGCTPPVINGAIHFVPTGDWSQFFVMPGGDNELDEGDYVVYLDLTSDKDASGVDLTMQNGWGGTAQAITAKVPVAAGRHSVKIEMPKVEGGNYDIILKPQTADATLDVHSVRVCKITKSNSIPLTDEEKKSRLTDAMGKWIDGMMEATNGYVTSWEVVNEALSGDDKDGDGKYDLQHAATASADDKKNCFYWQDYLGDIDYVRLAVADARKSFAAHNGDPEKLKLFINDYNLESDWDDNGKLRSLIQWIKDWEADGVTKIDGIASQMHISCYADPNTQKSKKDHIVKMLELMKESGKLCKISELDMGYVDAAGKEVKTADITEEQHKEMRDLYTFVLQKYFEIIPAAQQYGITQWCATDAPKDSGWRPGLPVGLWDLNYLRKHTYAGFAVGLGAPEYWKEAK